MTPDTTSFWSDLRSRLDAAETMQPEFAAGMMTRFINRSRHLWPAIEIDLCSNLYRRGEWERAWGWIGRSL